ncbi:hypothetical protein GQ44DRAFT_797260 [Phaeosphaeriaceae sp. PMI808]|nr:hypothetical protein GQ44DRAFT_797260 [Phaeosphaeriaceae sp. PMI808]
MSHQRESSGSLPIPHITHVFNATGCTIIKDGKARDYPYITESPIDADLRRQSKSTDLTPNQNHHMRSSPPIQPGEQPIYSDKLPSFSEFVHITTRANTPPRTPVRRNDSADSSPRVRPQFEEVTWQETKRRRVDTLGDIYQTRPSLSNEQPPSDPRRMNSAIDPALNSRHSPQPVGSSMQHHRPSLSYPPPHGHGHAPVNMHSRHKSSPAPQGYPASQEHPAHQGYPSSQGYPGPHRQSAPQEHSAYRPAAYEHKHSYYQEPAPAPNAYPYERPQDPYYNRPSYAGAPHPGYENSYNDIRFQQHVGLDHNAFNRKRRGNLPKEATNILKSWFHANRPSPYPSEDQKLELCQMTGLSLNQVSNWFINARRRQPQKEAREREGNGSEAPA